MTKVSLKDCVDSPITNFINFPEIGKVKIHTLGLKGIGGLRSFYNKNYREGYILGDTTLFRWMFKNNGGHVSVMSLESGQIIAHQAYVPVIFTDGDVEYKGFISASTMVDAEYRRRGLMTHLRGDLQKRYDMAVSLGGSAKGVSLYTSMGYTHSGDLIRVIAIVDPKKCQEITQNTDKLKKTVELNQGRNSSVRSIGVFEDFSGELDSLRNEVLPPKTYFGVKRDAEFLDWRYVDVPYNKYERFGFWSGGKLKAVIVFRKEFVPAANSSIIRIVELLGRKESVQELIKNTVLTKDVSADVGWIDWFCSNESICETVKPLGFVTPDELFPAVVTIFTKPVDYYKTTYPFMFWSKDASLYKTLPTFDKWYVTKGDGDADRPNDSGGKQ